MNPLPNQPDARDLCGWLLRCFIALTLAHSTSNAREDMSLRDIVDNIRRNEELYGDIEMHVKEHYTLQDMKTQRADLIKSRDRETRLVYQGEYLFFQQIERAVSVGGESQELTTSAAYDGKQTRAVKGDELVNIRDEPYRGVGLLRPHAFLLKHLMGKNGSLSSYMSSGAVARGKTQITMDWRYAGAEHVDGLLCLKVRCDRRSGAKAPKTAHVLWLAPERNYLPIKMEFTNSAHHVKLPKSSARVTRLDELQPGVWFPMAATEYTYDEERLWENRAVVGGLTTFTFTSVQFSPQYDVEFFRDIATPKGSRVFELKGGKVVRSYTADSPERLWTSTWRTVTWFLLPAVFAILILSLYARSRRRNANP